MRVLLFLVCIQFFMPCYGNETSNTQVVYFGAGGERLDKDDTDFDPGFRYFSSFTKEKKFDTDYYYSVKHKKSLQMAQEAIGYQPKEFTSENWVNKIDALKKDLGKMPKGGRIMLVLDSHGVEQDGEFKTATTDGIVAPKKDLGQLIKAAEDNDVTLALVTTNCTSGSLIDLSSDKTCVITTSMSGQLSWFPDGAYMFDSMRTSSNLEEAFLKARDENSRLKLPSQPIISSPAGKKTQKVMEMLFPYLSRQEVEKPGTTDLCQFPTKDSLLDIKRSIYSLKRPSELLGYKLLLGNDDIRNLEDAVTQYNNSVREFQDSLRLVDQIRCFNTPIPLISHVGFGMGNPILNLGMGMTGPQFYELKNRTKETSLKSCVATPSDVSTQLRYHREQLEKAMAQSQSYELQEKLKGAIKELTKLSTDPVLFRNAKQLAAKPLIQKESLEGIRESRDKISYLERKIYTQLYKKFSEELKDQKNPCRDFSL